MKMDNLGSLQKVKPSNQLEQEIRRAVYNYHASTDFKIHSFAQQLVNGINYFVKFQADDSCYLAKVYSSFDQNSIEVIDVISCSLDDDIYYF